MRQHHLFPKSTLSFTQSPSNAFVRGIRNPLSFAVHSGNQLYNNDHYLPLAFRQEQHQHQQQQQHFQHHRTIMSGSNNPLTDETTTNALTSSSSSLALSLLDRILPVLLRAGSVVAGLVAILGGVLYVKQESLLYFPEIGGIPRQTSKNPRGYRSPAERAVPFEDYYITCADGVQIHAWLLLYQQQNQNPDDDDDDGINKQTTDTSKTPTILFFHGNAGNIGLRLPNALQMVQNLHANIMLVEYRGYGNSDNVSPTEAGLKLDAQAALQFILKEKPDSPILLFGRSLGGAVALDLAAHAVKHNLPVAGVMVENTFMSIGKMVDHLLPWLTPIKSVVLRMKWDSTIIVPQLTSMPTLYLAGGQDELVPPLHMQQLYQMQKENSSLSLNSKIFFHLVPDGTHNETWLQGGPAYWNAMKRFVRLVAGSAGSTYSATTGTTTSTRTGTSAAETTNTMPQQEDKSIPTMSSKFLDMARGAMATDENGKKKDV